MAAKIKIVKSLVIITDSQNMRTQTDKLTDKVTLCVTPEDKKYFMALNKAGKDKARRAWVNKTRKEYWKRMYDPNNLPDPDSE